MPTPRTFVIAAGLVLGSAGAAFAGAPGGGGPGGGAAACTPEEEALTVDGRAEVSARPDAVRLRAGVSSQAETLDQAQAKTSATAQRVIDALRALDEPGLELRTEAVELEPVYGPTPEGAEAGLPPIVGYRARNAVIVSVLDAPPDRLAEIASRIVDAAQRAGATELGGIELFLADEAAARDQALAEAVDDAERAARAMAAAAGLRVVRVLSIEANEEPRIMPLAMRAGAEAAADMPKAPVEAGEVTITAAVVARFAFEEVAPAAPAADTGR